MRGLACGGEGARRRAPALGMDAFVREDGGYTTVAVALALLVSLSLVFSASTALWVRSRSSEVQEVADASAMAGANCVAAFSTVAQTLDACVLSMGIAGVLLYGAGLVLSAIPFTRGEAPEVLRAAHEVLDARRDFAHSAAEGLSRLEEALPALIMLNSASCAAANALPGAEYLGCAVPFPATSQTDYSFLRQDVDDTELARNAQELQEAAEQKANAEERARAALERAWRADCVEDPCCLRERAARLAGLSGPTNPSYASAGAWRFGYALVRARNYYLIRMRTEAPSSSAVDELTRSAARSAFYAYAYEALGSAVCEEDGSVVRLELPELPHTSAMVRACSLYTEARWPCSEAGGVRTLHSCVACPAYGEPAGVASLAELEAGGIEYCSACGMDVSVLGHVADASTNITNGFEHYWQIVVEESRRYEEAEAEAARYDDELRRLGEKGADAFQEALDVLAVDRPKLRPAGAWGCVALVAREEGLASPEGLASAFTAGIELPAGMAIAGAALAPDNATEGNDVLSRLFDGVAGEGAAALVVGPVGSVCELWGKLLVAYGSSYERVEDAASDLFDKVGSLFGEKVAAWLKGKLSAVVKAAGFEPADMRLRKPVLVHTQQILDKDGRSAPREVRELVLALPATQAELSSTNWGRVATALGVGEVTIAELPVPGLDGVTIPLTIDVAKLLGAEDGA